VGLGGDQLERADHVELLDGVVEVVGQRDLLAAAAVLRGRPVPHLAGHRVRLVAHQQCDRLGHHQGRDLIGKVLMQVVEGGVKVRVAWLVHHHRRSFVGFVGGFLRETHGSGFGI
jgi:hypothetical protein